MRNPFKAFQSPQLPNDYFRLTVNILRYCGVEMYREETLLYSVYSKMFLFINVIGFTSVEIYEVFAQWGDLNAVLGVLNYLITHFLGTIKTGILFYNRKEIGKMMLALQREPFKPHDTRGGTEEAPFIRRIIKLTETQWIIYFLLCAGTVFAGLNKAIVIRSTKPEDEWIFPYAPTMSFGDWLKHSPFFELGIIYEFWSVTVNVFIIVTTDVLLASIMAHISVQMKILGNTFRNMRTRAETFAGLERNDEVIINHHLDNLMNDAVEHHLLTLKLAKTMETLCSPMILCIFIACVILLCFLLYFSSLFPIMSVEFFQNMCYWCIIVFHVGMYCLWGNEVSLESDNVAKAAAELDWPGASRKVTHAVVMIVQRAQRPLFITAGKFVPLSMEVFLRIIKGSISYYMVLKQTQGLD